MLFDKNKKLELVTVGSDPEFVIVTGNSVRSADEFFRFLTENTDADDGDEDYYNASLGIEVSGAGNLGWDGAGTPGELRPIHSDSPVEHAENIAMLLRFIKNKQPSVKFRAVQKNGHFVSTGGHLHFGLSDQETGYAPDRITGLMSALALPLLAADGDKYFARKRAAGGNIGCDSNFSFTGYGQADDWRTERRSGVKVLEFRAPTSSWLATQSLATAILSAYGAIFDGLIMAGTTDKFQAIYDRMEPYIKNLYGLHRLLLLDESRKVIAPVLNAIRKEISRLPNYKKWEKEIRTALNAKWQENQVKMGEDDIFSGWKLNSKNRIPLYLMRKGVKLKEEEIEQCRKFYMPSASSDHNVNLFALEMAKAQLKLDWRPNKTYRLFGLRQGANAYLVMNANNEGAAISVGPGVLLEESIQNAYESAQGLAVGVRTIGEKRKHVAIGIPYELRDNADTNGFLDLLWHVDHDKIKLIGDYDLIRQQVQAPMVNEVAANSQLKGQAVCAE